MSTATGRIFIEQSGLMEAAGMRLTDQVLVKNGKITVDFPQSAHLIVLPVTGDLYYHSPDKDQGEINVAELKVWSCVAGSSICLVNPYAEEEVNFILIRIVDPAIVLNISFHPAAFDFDVNQNQLIPLFPVENQHGLPFHVSIGRFAGRAEHLYQMKNKNTGFFAFVIAGVFEIEGRLLHPRDGLSLLNADHIESEALSNHAVLLVLESAL